MKGRVGIGLLAVMAAALMLGIAAVLPGGTQVASAQEIPEDFSICHRTDSASNPYVVNSPSNFGDVQGHAGHTGAIATTPAVAQAIKTAGGMWGDIIPPIPALDFAGLNWTAEGEAIWENDCNFVEPPATATLTIVKECDEPSDGTDFTIVVSEDGTTVDSVILECGQDDAVTGLFVGVEYIVSENPPSGWLEPSIRGLCDGDGSFTMPANGGTCVVHNEPEDFEETATLFIEKECIGTDDSTIFAINISGGIGTVNLECGETSDPITVDADTVYTVSETPPTGWTGPNIRGLCDGDGTFSLEPDDEGTCVVSNVAEEEELGSIDVFKACNPGADATADFTFTLYDASDDGVVGTDTVGCGETASFTGLPAGDYYVIETGMPVSFDQTASNCDDITVDVGDDEACTVTNIEQEEALPPAAIVETPEPTVEIVEAQPPAAPVEPTPVAQVLGVQQVIRPPSTGEGGLADSEHSRGFMTPLLMIVGVTGLVTALSVRRLRHLKRR